MQEYLQSYYQYGGLMKKRDVLYILTKAEIAKIIERNASQVTRMPTKVPERHRQAILNACVDKARQVNIALKRLLKG